MRFLTFLANLYRILAEKPQTPKPLQNNALLQMLLNRRSIRAFLDKDIPEDVVNAILEAGRLAPSTVNLQTWTFAVFNRDEWQQKFGDSIPFKAALAVIVLGDIHRARRAIPDFPDSPLVEFTISVMNASLAAMNMNIAAESLGVSSVMLSETGKSGLLDAAYLIDRLSLPERVYPLMTIVFGYARRSYPPMPPKLPPEAIFIRGNYLEASQSILDDWMSQTQAGYLASYKNSTFQSQLEVYRRKINQAEAELEQIIYPGRAGKRDV